MREPSEWKSRQWWRNRPLEERSAFFRAPRRLVNDVGLDPDVDWDEWEAGDNLLVYGPADTGKSRLACSKAYSLLHSHKVSARWVASDNYVEWIKDSFDSDGMLGEEYSSPFLIKNVKGVYDIIVLDGLGEERQTDFAVHELGSLIRGRYDDMLTTIITTRLTPTELIKRYGERISGALKTYELETP